VAGLLPVVVFPDVELWLTGYLRTGLTAAGWTGVRVATTKEPGARSVWVRGDGGRRLDAVRAAARVGVNVFADGANGQAVSNLARLVHALVGACPDGRPVLAVSSLTQPFPIDDPTGQPCRYLTAELIVRGSDNPADRPAPPA
jgi:hypothetical protein